MDERWRRRYPGKYRPLTDYLAEQSGDALTLTFAEIARIVRAPLPPSAWTWAWWTNTSRSQPQVDAWYAAGWRVASVDTRLQVVTFVREIAGGMGRDAAK